MQHEGVKAFCLLFTNALKDIAFLFRLHSVAHLS